MPWAQALILAEISLIAKHIFLQVVKLMLAKELILLRLRMILLLRYLFKLIAPENKKGFRRCEHLIHIKASMHAKVHA